MLKLECNKCGGARIKLADEATDDAMLVCQDCGENLLTLGDLKAEVARRAFEIESGALESFQTIKGLKPH
jgi:hypothetical protein